MTTTSLALRKTGPYVVVLVIASNLYYVASQQIISAGDGRIGADFWPKTILALTIVTCLWEVARHLLQSGRNEPGAHGLTQAANDKSTSQGSEAPSDQAPRFAPWIGIATATAYVFALDRLGYVLATFLFVAIFIYLGNYRRLVVVIPVALVASLTFMFLFMKVVYVSLPLGVEPFLQVSTFVINAMGIK